MASSYKLKLSDDVRDLVSHLHPEIKRKVRTALSKIIKDPLSGKGLRGELQGMRSLRVSKFRIIYRPVPDIIEVIAIGPRRTIYEETLRLIRKERREKS
ncbi:MAG TPA: type II toxin-antitoxin system RelE/ParE family toxin [Thermodesulfobacteriota bacterium]|nr:type II toxin-antitoxin system RelE/ParE family toxin [Thermodesulfobacteriota bacterium]